MLTTPVLTKNAVDRIQKADEITLIGFLYCYWLIAARLVNQYNMYAVGTYLSGSNQSSSANAVGAVTPIIQTAIRVNTMTTDGARSRFVEPLGIKRRRYCFDPMNGSRIMLIVIV